jgi:hypothetical protein
MVNRTMVEKDISQNALTVLYLLSGSFLLTVPFVSAYPISDDYVLRILQK